MNIKKHIFLFYVYLFAANKYGLYFECRLYFGRWKSIPSRNFYTLVANILKKFLITISEKGLGVLGIGSIFKNKFASGESCRTSKKSEAKKIIIKNDMDETYTKKIIICLDNLIYKNL
jgi:hypothetical protein